MRLIFATFFTPILFAGVSGVVRDPSGAAIPDATIDCAGRTARSDASGQFTIPGPSGCRASVAAAGFETRQADLGASPADITLALAPLASRVVVTATRGETTLEQAGVAGNVVTSTDLRQRQYPLVAEMLREFPGIHVTNYGRPGGLSEVYVRGGSATGTLVLIDGMPVNDPGGSIDFAHLASGSLDRVEVVRGPESAVFGAEAATSVVQLFTGRGDPERRVPHGSFSYERGTFQTDRWIANLSGGSGERFDYALSAEQFHTVGQFQNDAYRNTTGSANLGFRLAPATQIRAILRSWDSCAGSPSQTEYRIFDNAASLTHRDYTATVRLDDARGTRFVQRLLAGWHRQRLIYSDPTTDGPYDVAALVRDEPGPVPRVHLVRLLDTRFPLPATPPGLRLAERTEHLYPLDQPSVGITQRVDLDYQGTLTERHGATVFGYDFERQSGAITSENVARENHGLFVHQQYTLGGRLHLSGGARAEQNSAFGSKFTPRGAVSYRLLGAHGPLSSTLVRVSAGIGIVDPSLLENFARDPYFVGNPRLRPEHTASLDSGIVQQWFGSRLRTELSVFDNRFRDLIVYVSPPDGPGTWANVSASHARGIELSGETKLPWHVSLGAAYTHLWSRVTSSDAPYSLSTGIGQELLRRPGNSGSVSAGVTPRRWFFQASARYLGERQDFDLFGVNRNPGFWLVSAGGAYKLTRHVSPFVRGDNLANWHYADVLGYTGLARTIRGGTRIEW